MRVLLLATVPALLIAQVKTEVPVVGTHTSGVATRFQNFVLPFFSKNLCKGGKDRR